MVLARLRASHAFACLLLAVLVLTGCQRPVATEPNYSRPLPPGAFGLRLITDPARMPDLDPAATQLRDPAFQAAAQRSVAWFQTRSSQQHFPLAGRISHAHAWTSVYALTELGRQGGSPQELLAALQADFDVWESIGWDGSGTVLYTGYYSPVFEASRTRTPRFQYPIYRRPSDLQSDPVTGEVIGSYPARSELERSGVLSGLELVYLPSRMDAYIIEVNGSARLNLVDGGTMYVGFAGTNGHEYTSIRQLMIEAGVMDEDRAGLPAMREYFRQNPDQLDRYIRRNNRMAFFQEYTGDTWPAGSMGFKVTPMRTLATDKSIFPRGSVVLVTTTIPQANGAGHRPFHQLMVDQDTGGAIRAAGRGDIYIGVGPEAERLAGRQAAEGQMYYLLLKRERVQAWFDRMQTNRGAAASVR